MPQQYTQEELWKLFDKLPDELKEAVFSEETAEHTFAVCERHGIEEVSEVARYVGLILMGTLTPEEFQTALAKEVGLKKAVAKEVSREINRFIFYPVKSALEQLHRVETEKKTPTSTSATADRGRAVSEEERLPRVVPKEQSKKSQGTDPYRESIE